MIGIEPNSNVTTHPDFPGRKFLIPTDPAQRSVDGLILHQLSSRDIITLLGARKSSAAFLMGLVGHLEVLEMSYGVRVPDSKKWCQALMQAVNYFVLLCDECARREIKANLRIH